MPSATPDRQTFPVFLAAPPAFLQFCRDESDTWSPSIEEINKRAFDTIKLHRVSFFLDVGLPSGSPMGFAFDGTLLMPRDHHHCSADHALDDFNRVIALLGLGGLQLNPIGSPELAEGYLNSTGYFRYTRPLGSTAKLHEALGEADVGAGFGIELHEPRTVFREQVEQAWARGRAVADPLNECDVANLYVAISALERGRPRDCMIYAWSLVEQLVAQLWSTQIIPAARSLHGRPSVLRGVGKNVSTRIEILVEAGHIGDDLYQHLYRARKARNQYIHAGVVPDFPACESCLLSAVALVGQLCTLHDALVDLEPVTTRVTSIKEPIPQRSMVATAGDVDWSRPLFYRTLRPIPGDQGWEGPYESFQDTTLAKQ